MACLFLAAALCLAHHAHRMNERAASHSCPSACCQHTLPTLIAAQRALMLTHRASCSERGSEHPHNPAVRQHRQPRAEPCSHGGCRRASGSPIGSATRLARQYRYQACRGRRRSVSACNQLMHAGAAAPLPQDPSHASWANVRELESMYICEPCHD